MKQSGQIVLVPFPFTDLSGAKLSTALGEMDPPIVQYQLQLPDKMGGEA